MKGFVPTPPGIVELMSRKLFSSMPPGRLQSLLDPGCGTGVFLDGVIRWCRSRGLSTPRLAGIELNPALAGLLRRKWSGRDAVTILHADFLGHPLGLYDYIIGNPPYVSICKMSEREKTRFRGRFRTAHGRFDLYLLFFERALESLAPGGRLVFITPEKFTYVASASPLRRLLARMHVEEVHLVEESAFGDLVTYPAITTIRNRPPAARTRILLRDGSQRSVTLPTDGSSWLPAMNGHTGPTPPWSLADACDRVSCGVATGADSVFVLRHSQVPTELRPFAYPTIAGRDLSDGVPLSDRVGRSMLIPYRHDGRLRREAELGPLASYLRDPERRAKLLGRTCVARKPWYSFHENPPLRDILRPKLLCKDIGSHPVFFVDERGDLVPRHSVYYIVPKNPEHLHALASYLNSPPACAWLRNHCQRAANGFLRLQSSVLKLLPIPDRFVAPTGAESADRRVHASPAARGATR